MRAHAHTTTHGPLSRCIGGTPHPAYPPHACTTPAIYTYIYMCVYIYICNPAHRVSRPRGTGSVGDSVGEGMRRCRRPLPRRPLLPSPLCNLAFRCPRPAAGRGQTRESRGGKDECDLWQVWANTRPYAVGAVGTCFLSPETTLAYVLSSGPRAFFPQGTV